MHLARLARPHMNLHLRLHLHVHWHFDSHVHLHNIHDRVFGGIHISIHDYACAHKDMPSVDYTAREREAEYIAKDRDFSAHERLTTFGTEE